MELNRLDNMTEEQLEHEYMKVNPNRQLIQNKFNGLVNNPVWNSNETIAEKEERVKKLKSEISDFFDELISYQEGLGAALTVVNLQNQELGTLVKK